MNKLKLFSIVVAFISMASPTQHGILDSVVGVYVEYPSNGNPNLPTKAFGSGVILSDKGYIVTNHHVVSHAQNVIVQTNSGQKGYANVVGSAPDFDLAILKIEPLPNQKLTPIKMGRSNHLKIGEDVTAVGNAFGFEQTLSQGVISQLDREVSLSPRVKSYIQVDAAVNPGNSGGALLNESGELIGIVSGIYGPRFNIGIAFAIPIDIASPIIDQLITKGHVIPGWVGMTTQPLTPELKDAFNTPEYDGVVISEILPGSPAQQANLKAKDIILKVNDTEITSPQHFASLITAQGSQSMVNLSYVRDQKIKSARFKTGQPTHTLNTGLGHWGINLQEYEHMNFDGHSDRGIEINQVQLESSGYLSGLQPGDIIKSVDNIEVHNLNDFSKNEFTKTERTHLLEIERNNRTFFVPLR